MVGVLGRRSRVGRFIRVRRRGPSRCWAQHERKIGGWGDRRGRWGGLLLLRCVREPRAHKSSSTEQLTDGGGFIASGGNEASSAIHDNACWNPYQKAVVGGHSELFDHCACPHDGV